MKHVLFVCNHNAGRSQMAEAFFNHHAPDDVRAESAGNEPAAEIWPEVVEVMAERGFDLAAQEPKKVTVEMQLRADWAVAVGCEDTCPFVPTTLEEWEIPDPAGTAAGGGARDPRSRRAARPNADHHTARRHPRRPDASPAVATTAAPATDP